MNNHSYEEIRAVILDIISGKEKVSYDPNQYGHVECGVAEVLAKRESISRSNGIINSGNYPISSSDKNLVLEIFGRYSEKELLRLGWILRIANSHFSDYRFMGRRLSIMNKPTFSMMCLPIASDLKMKSRIWTR